MKEDNTGHSPVLSMNTFRLEFELVQQSSHEELLDEIFRKNDPEVEIAAQKTPREPQWKGTPFADDVEIPEHATIDYIALLKSSVETGDYYVFNCSCRTPACASIEEPITVSHENEIIRWHIADAALETLFEFFKKNLT